MNTNDNYIDITEENYIDITLEGDYRYRSKLAIITEERYFLRTYCSMDTEEWSH